MAPDRGSILLVDDSEEELELMRHYLEPFAMRIDCASHGREALEFLQAQGEVAGPAAAMPRLIIIDGKMPVMNGIDAIEEMRKSPALRATPIVMWSGSSDPSDIRRAYENGATSYLVKPSGPAEAKEALRLTVRYWTALHVRQ